MIIGFITSFISGLVLLPVLVYLADILVKMLIKKDELVLQKDLNIKLEEAKKEFNKELENEKTNLNAKLEEIKAQHIQDIERLKSELSHQNSRLQIAYSGVYKDQVEALRSLYTLILEFEVAIRDRRNLNIIDPSKYKKPAEILNTFKTEFYKNAIFLPHHLDEKILKIIGFGFSKFLFDKFLLAEQKAIQGELDEANKLSDEGFNNDAEFIELRDDFRNEIRKILAVH